MVRSRFFGLGYFLVWGMVALSLVGLSTSVAMGFSAQAPTPEREFRDVLVTDLHGVVTPVMEDHIASAMRKAEREDRILVVEMDTPGGLDSSMRDIARKFLNADIPIVVHVTPRGARAASAGAIIAMAAHVMVMSPSTSIGAATPIDLAGEDLERKVINDAMAYAEGIARLRGRNIGFARDAVEKGRSITDQEALQIGVADLLAGDREELLALLDGRKLVLSSGPTQGEDGGIGEQAILRTREADVKEAKMGGLRQFLQWLADPNVAFLFLSLGTLAILYEVINPGMGAGGILGVILLLLAFFSLSVLPVNATGVVLLLLALVLFIAELFAPGVGVLGAGGTAALILGGAFLFRGSVAVDFLLLLPVALLVCAGVIFAGRLAWRARGAPPVLGADTLLGARSTIHRCDSPSQGWIFLNGAWWMVSPDPEKMEEELEKGQDVEVVGRDGLTLLVRFARKSVHG